MTGYKSKKAAALDEDGMYLVHQTAQPAQELVAFINAEQRTFEWAKPTSWHTPTVVNLPKIPLYTAPPQRPWVDLTPQDLNEIFEVARTGEHAVRLALDKIKEKQT